MSINEAYETTAGVSREGTVPRPASATSTGVGGLFVGAGLLVTPLR
jgi:hypothetical protein